LFLVGVVVVVLGFVVVVLGFVVVVVGCVVVVLGCVVVVGELGAVVLGVVGPVVVDVLDVDLVVVDVVGLVVDDLVVDFAPDEDLLVGAVVLDVVGPDAAAALLTVAIIRKTPAATALRENDRTPRWRRLLCADFTAAAPRPSALLLIEPAPSLHERQLDLPKS
jgi:hypothetical protein